MDMKSGPAFKILILANDDISLYKFRHELVDKLIGLGYIVYVACPDFDDSLWHGYSIERISIPLSRRSANFFQDFKLLLRYRKTIRQIKPDVILTYTIKPNIYGNLAAPADIPVISTITGLGDSIIRKSWVRRAVKLLYRISFKKTSCIVFQNDEDIALFRDWGILKTQRHIKVMGSGVNLSDFTALDMPKDEPVNFLYVGRLMKTKGVIELIEACKKLYDNGHRSFFLSLIGRIEDDDIIKEYMRDAESLNYIDYSGYQSDVTGFLKKCHCVVLPSYKEGMSNTLLEAAASGRPLIACDVSGCREIIKDKMNGFLCKPRDAGSLYAGMEEFLSLTPLERETMGQASRKAAEEHFNRDDVIKSMLQEIHCHIAQGQ